MANNEIENIKGIGPKAAKTLVDCGFNTVEKLAEASAEELAQLPGIGKATAESMILSANEVLAPTKKPAAKAPAKKAEVKSKIKTVDKATIPKPPTLKKKVEEPSVRPSVKTPKSAPKAPAKKPAVKKPAEKSETKKPVSKKPVAKPKASVAVKKGVSLATVKAIERAKGMRKIKSKVSKKKTKAKKKVSLSKTYGIVHSVLHDASGSSKNRSVILHLHNIELPINSYLGRKVSISYVKSGKQLTGRISRIHGKSSSSNKAVIVRFQKGVSPHIVSAKATFK